MTMELFHNIDKLAQAVETAASKCDIVTFDLFDTLLIRRVAAPDQIKDPVARYIALRAAQRGIRIDWRTVLERRWAIENRHRHANGLRHPDSEAVYPAFMGDLLAEIFGAPPDATLLREVTDYELRMENSVLVPRARMMDLLRGLRARGIRIWILTDIYLPAAHIGVLLQHAGLAHLTDGLTSSADECRAKASGAGFERLRERLELDPARWLHVGDNIHSDGRKPSAMGIRAFVLRDKGEILRKRVYCALHYTAIRRRIARAGLWRRLAAPLEAERVYRDVTSIPPHPSPTLPDGAPAPRDPTVAARLYRDGYNLFGPPITAFVRHVAAQARARGLRRIYFFAREGAMFMDIWQQALPFWFPEGNAPEARYLHVSRLALAPAACAQQGLSHCNAPMALLPAKNRDLRDVCRVYGLDADGLRDIFAKHNLTPVTTLNPIYRGWTADAWSNFDQLLHDPAFQSAVREQTAERGRLLESYLAQQGFFDHPEIGVVDIGWLGTIQRFLYDAVAHRRDCPRLHGFLLAATHGVPYPASPKNDIEGFIYDRRRHDGMGRFITYALDIFEEACREPAPGVIGYHAVNNEIRPCFMPANAPARRREVEQDAYFAPLQQGIRDFAARAAPAMEILDYHSIDLLPGLTLRLVRQMAFPSTATIRRLRRRAHLDEYEGRHRPPLRIRLRLTGLWDLPLGLLRWMPGLRAGFFAWHAAGLFWARRIYGWLFHRHRRP